MPRIVLARSGSVETDFARRMARLFFIHPSPLSSHTMKGPGFRIGLDCRRTWECPACGRRLKLHGHVASFSCDCRGAGSEAMRLVEPLHRTESPFDHVGFAAQKRIDAAIRKSHAEDEDQVNDVSSDAEFNEGLADDADLRPTDAALPETTGEVDADAPPPTVEEPPSS